ncbi:hypothetical protein AB0F30_15070 [Streptomyces sp. NPDC029006]|uniref:hypothetical protein n=1 Tax=Streptomyces sp. NPDC029006 TaxID=3155467 RepID=UPI0033D6664C
MREETGKPADSGRTGHSAADILYRFLTAERAHRESLAPRVVAAVGGERLDRMLESTRERVGDITGYGTTPTGW